MGNYTQETAILYVPDLQKNGLSDSASGYRLSYSGDQSGESTHGYYWSSSPHSAASVGGSYLDIYSGNVISEGYSNRTNGFPGRCVQE